MKEYAVKYETEVIAGECEKLTLWATFEEASDFASKKRDQYWTHNVRLLVREVSEWEEV